MPQAAFVMSIALCKSQTYFQLPQFVS